MEETNVCTQDYEPCIKCGKNDNVPIASSSCKKIQSSTSMPNSMGD